MTTAFTAQVSIGHDADLVWRTITDWPHAADWMPGIERSRADGPTAVGMALAFEARGKQRSSTVVAVEPGRAIVLRSVQGGVTADYTYELTPNETGTLVALTADVTTAGAWKLLGPVVRAAIRRADSGQLDALAAQVRARASSS